MMPDLRFEIGFTTHPKLKQLGPLETDLHVRAIDYAALNLTDGFISVDALNELARPHGLVRTDSPRTLPGIGETITPGELAAALITAGVWHESDGGWLIHDFADFQVTRSKLHAAFDTVTRRRERDAQRKTNGRVRGHASADATPAALPLHARDPGQVVLQSFSSTDSRSSDQDRAVGPAEQGLETSDFGALEPFRRLAERVRDSDAKSPVVWAHASRGLPKEQAAGAAWDALRARRQDDRRGSLRSEAAFVTATLKALRDSSGVSDAVA